MIDIYGTVINENEIIGVGPFMVKRPADPITSSNEQAFYFVVYTTRYHFTISTDWLPFKGSEIETGNSKLIKSAILQAHTDLKECLISGRFTGMRLPHRDD